MKHALLSLLAAPTLITLSWSANPVADRSNIVRGQVLVKFTQAQADAVQRQIRSRGITLVPNGTYRRRIGKTGWTVWDVPASTDTTRLAAQLRARRDVAYAQPVHKVSVLLNPPNDADYGVVEMSDDLYLILDPDDNVYRFNRLWPLDEINAMAAWSNYPNQWYTAASKPKRTPTIAVIDSGCDMDHPDFRNAGATSADSAAGGQLDWIKSRKFLLGGPDPNQGPVDENGHGTHVAGIALAAANNGGFNGHGMIGVGYNSRGMILRVINAGGSGTDADAAAAMIYAADNGADIINLSLGTPDFSLILQEAVTYAFQKGCVVVAAANESASPSNLPPNYPSACSGAISVTATTGSHLPASNYAGTGNYIDIAAPGGDLVNDEYGNYLLMFLFSTMPRERVYLNDLFYIPTIQQEYTYLYGTSMASPHVAGALGLYFGKFGLSQAGGWANVRAMQALQRSAMDSGYTSNGSWDPVKGFGDLDAEALLLEADARSAIAGSIEGMVYAGTPAANASVRATKGATTISTNSLATGLYRFGELAPGTWTITTKAGFLTKVRKVVVKAGCETPGVDFWCGGNPSDTTPPTVARFAVASASNLNSVSVRHWAYDTETGVDSVVFRVGTTRGGSNIKTDTEIVIDGEVATITGLSLVTGSTYWIRATYMNGAELVSIADTSFVADNGFRTVSGTIELQDYARDPYGHFADVEVRAPGSSLALETHRVRLGENGAYSIGTTRTGAVEIAAKADHWLRASAPLTVLSGATSGPLLSLMNGDVDGDNAITVFDYTELSDAFDTDEFSDLWNPLADLDGDGSVTVFDYSVLSANFDQVGSD